MHKSWPAFMSCGSNDNLLFRALAKYYSNLSHICVVMGGYSDNLGAVDSGQCQISQRSIKTLTLVFLDATRPLKFCVCFYYHFSYLHFCDSLHHPWCIKFH